MKKDIQKKIFKGANWFLFPLLMVLILSSVVLLWTIEANSDIGKIIHKDSSLLSESSAPDLGGVVSLMELAQGKQVYTIMTDRPKNPQILEVIVDPLDAKQGEEQTITVKVEYKDTDTITSDCKMWVTYITDNKSEKIPLQMRRVDGPPLVVTWEGVWEVEDTYDNIYTASIEAALKDVISKVDLSFR